MKKIGKYEFGSWLKANSLFLKDNYWMGSDDAYSIKLGKERILWLFGDTLIAKEKGNRNREADNTFFLNNTIGISNGVNPADSDIEYFWKHKNDVPVSYFIHPGISEENWLWPGDGAVVADNYLVLFFMDIKPVNSEWGFDIAGWQVAVIRNYKANPADWNIEWLSPGEFGKYKVMLGSGGVIVEDGYLYAYGGKSAIAGNDIFLARWPEIIFDFKNPGLSNPEWWCGNEIEWVNEENIDSGCTPEVVWCDGQNEFTVNKFPGEDFYIMTQFQWCGEIGNADLVCRISDSLTGPWSERFTLFEKMYREKDVPVDLNVYAGKLHPELTDGNDDTLVFTFATNTKKLETLWAGNEIYYPGFIRLSRKEVLKSLGKLKESY